MTRDDIIRMAREQGLPETATEGVFIVNADDLGRMLRRYALCDNQPVQRFVGRRNAQEREPAMQDALMKFDPATGEERPYPSHATQWRNWHGIAAWLFDPWTGKRRNAYDVGSDVYGLLIAPAGTLGMDMGGGSTEKNNVAGGLVGSADGIKAQPAPSTPEGWLRAIDEALVVAHIGMANADDTYAQAKSKLDTLISLHADIATDPAVNGGWKLVPTAESRHPGIYKMLGALHAIDNTRGASEWESYAAMLAAAPEAKP